MRRRDAPYISATTVDSETRWDSETQSYFSVLETKEEDYLEWHHAERDSLCFRIVLLAEIYVFILKSNVRMSCYKWGRSLWAMFGCDTREDKRLEWYSSPQNHWRELWGLYGHYGRTTHCNILLVPTGFDLIVVINIYIIPTLFNNLLPGPLGAQGNVK